MTASCSLTHLWKSCVFCYLVELFDSFMPFDPPWVTWCLLLPGRTNDSFMFFYTPKVVLFLSLPGRVV